MARTKEMKTTLSPVEEKARVLMLDGKTPKAVADILKVSRSRARTVCSRIYVKTGVENQVDMLAEELKEANLQIEKLSK